MGQIMNKRHKKTKTPSKRRVLGAKAGYCAYTLYRALPSGWTDQLSHPSGPTPGPIPVLCLVAQSCPTLCNPMDCRQPGSSVRGDSPSRNTGEGCHALLQGIFPIQGSNPGLSHCRHILYHLSHQGSPSLLLPYIKNQLTLPQGVRKENCCLFLLRHTAARFPINPCLNFLCDFLSISID